MTKFSGRAGSRAGRGGTRARALAAGSAQGTAVVLGEPLSLWGGMDPRTGRLVDRRHPQRGTRLAGRILVMPSGRGSSSSSTVLAEAIRLGTAPGGIILGDPDPILALGSVVAARLYGRRVPVVVLGRSAYRALATGQTVAIAEGPEGTAVVRITSPPARSA